MRLKRWVANIISGFIPNESRRKKFRTKLQFETKWCLEFVRNYMGDKNVKLDTYVGHGCLNYIVVANRKYVFKFPIHDGTDEDPTKEKRITDYFAKKLSITVPTLEIIKHNGRYIKKYDFIDGVTLADVDRKRFDANRAKIASQIADFIFTMSTTDPRTLGDLKPRDAGRPGFMYGWGHRDIGGNFILNPKTMDVIGFIDYENAGFGDLMQDFRNANRHWSRRGYDSLGIEILKFYTEKYIAYINKK
ncbi:MAG: hypothetical protein J5742_01040 [Alphaproteobacteria bacterium]|nr:hypothetical protein [Alphaproteobacteria bacterium]